GIQATAALIVSRAKAWARSALATRSGGCRRLLAARWPLTGTISRQRSISGEHISLIVSGPACSSRHRPAPAARMTADKPPELDTTINSAHQQQAHQQQRERSLGAADSTRAAAAEVLPWPGHDHPTADDAADPPRLEGCRELPDQRRVRGLSEPHLARRCVRLRPFSLRQRASAVLP